MKNVEHSVWMTLHCFMTTNSKIMKNFMENININTVFSIGGSDTIFINNRSTVNCILYIQHIVRSMPYESWMTTIFSEFLFRTKSKDNNSFESFQFDGPHRNVRIPWNAWIIRRTQRYKVYEQKFRSLTLAFCIVHSWATAEKIFQVMLKLENFSNRNRYKLVQSIP